MTSNPGWRKSSHSAGSGACVEVRPALTWRKSSHSNGNGGSNCVEVAATKPRQEDHRVA